MKTDHSSGSGRADGDALAVFSNLESLLGVLPSESYMRVELDADPSRGRIPEEQFTVQVDSYLWYVKKEKINHYYHLILGSTADENAQHMIAEIPGPPFRSDDRDTIRRVREQLEELIGPAPGSDRFEALTPPPRIRVTGQLFFNGYHTPNPTGPTGHEPQSAWEIHPVSDLQAL